MNKPKFSPRDRQSIKWRNPSSTSSTSAAAPNKGGHVVQWNKNDRAAKRASNAASKSDRIKRKQSRGRQLKLEAREASMGYHFTSQQEEGAI